MTTYRMYRCNLCGDYIEPTDSTSKPGFGVHFVPGGASVFKRVHVTEKHICHQCARSVHDELRKVTPAERPCTCHPDDNPPTPCAKQYALADCRAAARTDADSATVGLTANVAIKPRRQASA